MRPPLPEYLFEPLAQRIAQVSGISVPASKRWLLTARVDDRMRALGQEDARVYVEHVLDERGVAELGQLVEAVRVGETQFFRHRGQLRAIRRVALPEIVARAERERASTVRVWSAGCATGEEAYTLAMMLEDALPSEQGWQHEVLATDMSERALTQAREGRYPAGSISNVPPHVARWAFARDGEDVVVTERAARAVRFEQRNLLASTYPRGFDLVLCRNVLIYFDRATQREVVERLARSVVAGGYLALGYAERLDGATDELHPIRTDDGVLYRRGDRSEPGPAHTPAGRPPARAPQGPASFRPRPAAAPPEPQPAPPIGPEPVRPARLAGELEGPAGVAEAHRVVSGLLQAEEPLLDLRDLRYADEAVARVLARAAAVAEAEGRPLVLLVDAPGTLRFLRRHGIVPPALVREGS